jgi:hypothetical protein
MRDSECWDEQSEFEVVNPHFTESEKAALCAEARFRGMAFEDVVAVLVMERLDTMADAVLPQIKPVAVRHLRIVK